MATFVLVHGGGHGAWCWERLVPLLADAGHRVFTPVLTGVGFDPVHMGVLLVVLINFGGLTPPVGVIMFTVCGVLDCKSGAFTKAALPFFAAMLVFFAVLVAFPGLTLFLPGYLM